MAYNSPYKEFIFEDYSFDIKTGVAVFNYSFDSERKFRETVVFGPIDASKQSYELNEEILDQALKLAFYTVGTSYYKTFPTTSVKFMNAEPDSWQADFLQKIYTEGLSQFFFENNLSKSDMPKFSGIGLNKNELNYEGSGNLVLQSGGKDSLLLASLLEKEDIQYTPWYIKYSDTCPEVLNELKWPLVTVDRKIDKKALSQAAEEGALNGHVPVTYIVFSYALIDLILRGKNTILAAIGAEGGEPHEFIENIPVNHQWAKSWPAEQLFSGYVHNYISSDINIGSPLRGFSELRIAELFAEHAWQRFGHDFSSCNRANYEQGSDNTVLRWCGSCPKCANSYLLFSPFIAPQDLKAVFNGQDLFVKKELTSTFKGLLGIDGVMKPFECIGEVNELRSAYHKARLEYGEKKYSLPFEVPESNFDYKQIQPHNKDIKPDLYDN